MLLLLRVLFLVNADLRVQTISPRLGVINRSILLLRQNFQALVLLLVGQFRVGSDGGVVLRLEAALVGRDLGVESFDGLLSSEHLLKLGGATVWDGSRCFRIRASSVGGSHRQSGSDGERNDRLHDVEPLGDPAPDAIDFKDSASQVLDCTHAPVAQLDRASGFEPEGREFESLRARHFPARVARSGRRMGRFIRRQIALLWLGLASLGLASSPVVATAAERILHRVGTDDPATVDPHKVSLPGEQLIVLDLFMGLTTPGMNGRPMPGSAESWTVSPDGKTYNFKLRPNTRWSDGRPLTATDWVWSFQRMLDPKTAFPLASRLFPIKHARAVATGAMPIERLAVRAVGNDTLVIELENPTPYFTDVIMSSAMPAPRHAIEKHGTAWLRPGNFVGNGAFVLKDWRPNAHVELVRNPNFWGASRVRLDGVFHYPLGNPATLVRRFDAGELDLILVVPPERTAELRQRHGESLRLGRGIANEVVVFNVKRGPTADVRVRRALAMLIEREVIARNIIGFPGVQAYSYVPPGVLNYSSAAVPDFAKWPEARRVAEARKLLTAAGYDAGKPLSLRLAFPSTDLNRKVAVAIGAMWSRAGVKVELQSKETKALFADVGVGNFDSTRSVWLAAASDPHAYLERLLSTGSAVGVNTSGYANPAFDALLAEASAEVDIERRAAKLREAEALALADMPVAPVYYLVGRRLVSKRVQGFGDNPRGLYPSWLMTVTPR